MELKKIEIDIFEITNTIFKILKGKNIKGISIKKKFNNTGNKHKWKDSEEMDFYFENISFSVGVIKYYEDPDDFNKRNILVYTNYYLKNIKKIKEENILNFLKGKLRVVKIEKVLNF